MGPGRGQANEPQGYPGTYALLLSSAVEGVLAIGRLGGLPLQRGFYLYIGSALGPGGLRARLAHHRRPAPHPHWHIDYLRQVARLEEVWFAYTPLRREHLWAGIAGGLVGALVPLRGFGASDCHCQSHLYFVSRRPSHAGFCRRLQATWPGHGPVAVCREGSGRVRTAARAGSAAVPGDG